MKVVNLMRTSSLLVAVISAVVFAGTASATNNCVFVQTTKKWTLQASCSTDATILIPNNFTLDGKGFKITAIDPPGGNFAGAILKNAGAVANVTNLFLRTNIADVCNDEANKVIGILLDKATSAISGLNITINKTEASVCAEGVGIQAQSLPFSPRGAFKKVTIKTSILNYNQRAGVLALGNINLRVDTNLIKGLGETAMAQRGVEVTAGAKAYILMNEIVRFNHLPIGTDPSYGVLLHAAGQSTVQFNTLNFNDYGVRVSGGTKITVRDNVLRSSLVTGILLDDGNGLATTSNTIWANDSGKSALHGIHLWNVSGLLTKNIVKSNLTERNTGSGILVEGGANKVQVNTSGNNTGFDIANVGSNLYSRNVCNDSSGPPVDCPAAP